MALPNCPVLVEQLSHQAPLSCGATITLDSVSQVEKMWKIGLEAKLNA